MKRPLYQAIALTLDASIRCRKAGNTDWYEKHLETIDRLIKNHMPSGSGIDGGTELSETSTPQRLVFVLGYHHMHPESGIYDDWTQHTVTVKPSLTDGIELKISGRDRNEIKDSLYQIYDAALRQEIEL